jgi:hypothetical protein
LQACRTIEASTSALRGRNLALIRFILNRTTLCTQCRMPNRSPFSSVQASGTRNWGVRNWGAPGLAVFARPGS